MGEAKDVNLWIEVGNRCLFHAKEMLEPCGTVSIEVAHAAAELIQAAVEIDELNRRWASQTRSVEPACPVRPF